MKGAFWTVVAIVGLVVTTYASIFLLAEVFTEVAVLRTYDANGDPNDTRVTVVDIDGTPWVRGRPYRGWFRRIEANSTAELRRGNLWLPVRGEISRKPADAAAFEDVMLEEYGLLYRYLDLIARMSSNEVPVRLVPRSP